MTENCTSHSPHRYDISKRQSVLNLTLKCYSTPPPLPYVLLSHHLNTYAKPVANHEEVTSRPCVQKSIDISVCVLYSLYTSTLKYGHLVINPIMYINSNRSREEEKHKPLVRTVEFSFYVVLGARSLSPNQRKVVWPLPTAHIYRVTKTKSERIWIYCCI